ncbi:hypothetical protein EXIGLDRAFT_302401 [Exidia glandulosa HHB12029]|uniref:Uncharacterized protein n=1 Tax=Exidia glandulosa HHB12029 TaxID=1314781 RepID=A0A165D739_EXIGL|nr:hypothetical protein EXIGLDRAFT_302401 [Exidia glandulosa HHB12029]
MADMGYDTPSWRNTARSPTFTSTPTTPPRPTASIQCLRRSSATVTWTAHPRRRPCSRPSRTLRSSRGRASLAPTRRLLLRPRRLRLLLRRATLSRLGRARFVSFSFTHPPTPPPRTLSNIHWMLSNRPAFTTAVHVLHHFGFFAQDLPSSSSSHSLFCPSFPWLNQVSADDLTVLKDVRKTERQQAAEIFAYSPSP